MRTFNMSWEELRMSVKNCSFTDCPRNNAQKLPVLFDRKEDSLSKVKFLVVSQDPGTSLKKTHNLTHSEEMENFLINDCLNSKASGTSPVNKMIKVFGNFNPSTDEIYWTHALKCVPTTSDKDIEKEWRKCAESCKNYFKEELRLIPSRRLAIIAFGNYALALCRHVLEDNRLTSVGGIIPYIETADPEKKFTFDEKEILLFPFVHPSKREMVLKGKYEAKNKERKFIEKIQQLDNR